MILAHAQSLCLISSCEIILTLIDHQLSTASVWMIWYGLLYVFDYKIWHTSLHNDSPGYIRIATVNVSLSLNNSIIIFNAVELCTDNNRLILLYLDLINLISALRFVRKRLAEMLKWTSTDRHLRKSQTHRRKI